MHADKALWFWFSIHADGLAIVSFHLQISTQSFINISFGVSIPFFWYTVLCAENRYSHSFSFQCFGTVFHSNGWRFVSIMHNVTFNGDFNAGFFYFLCMLITCQASEKCKLNSVRAFMLNRHCLCNRKNGGLQNWRLICCALFTCHFSFVEWILMLQVIRLRNILFILKWKNDATF